MQKVQEPHTHTSYLCEQCCYQIAMQGNDLPSGSFAETFHLARQTAIVFLQDTLNLIVLPLRGNINMRKSLERKIDLESTSSNQPVGTKGGGSGGGAGGDHTHKPGEVCLRCITSMVRSQHHLIETIKDYMYMGGQAIIFLLSGFGALVFGFCGLVLALFPPKNVVKTPEQMYQENEEYHANKKAKNEKARQEDDKYHEHRQRELAKKRREDEKH